MPEPRSVVLVSERALPEHGGVAVATSRIASQAHARGERVHVVSLSRDVAPGARHVHDRDGITYHALGRLPREEDAAMALADHTREVIDEAGADLVHGIYAIRAGYVATLAAAWAGVPAIVGLRGNDLDRGLFRAADLPFLQHAIARATIVTGVSRELCHKAIRAFGRGVDYVPNSVDAEAFRPEARDNSLVASLGLGTDAVIGFLGELREKKGMRFLLPAFAEVSSRRAVRLLLIGGVRGDCRDAFESFKASAPEAASRIHTIDYARSPKHLSRLVALCDVMVFPSLFEGMPNALLETMAAARPALVTSVGGHVDLIRHGETGALLPLAELDHLPEAIEELLDLSTNERAKLGRAARDYVLRHHAGAAESASYGRLYAQARGRGPLVSKSSA
jgi:glycosyltransferase involved in cell wall biosynthesis